MQYTLKTLLLVFVLVAATLALFGPWGLLPVAYLTCLVVGGRLVFHRKALGKTSLLLVLLFFPCLMITSYPLCRESPLFFERGLCSNNAREMGIALRSYHKEYGSFPPVCVTDSKGHPMHSWRVLLLPYLGKSRMYHEYRLDEPWNSMHNRKVAAETPSCFRCPCRPNPISGTTDYVAVTGPGTAWPVDGPIGMRDFRDGPNYTLLVIEIADSEIPWNAPRDLTLNKILADPEGTKAIMSYHDHTCRHEARSSGNVVLADGLSQYIYGRLPPETFKAMSTIAGREPGRWDTLKTIAPGPSPVKPNAWAKPVGWLVLIISFLLLVSRPLPEAWTRRKDGTEPTQPEDR
ncbi:MAG: DUF1559 domain-containing protein [Pirellulales bacterium]|nr:DUF1559 domain-containing protein [Pirellulales bacterium]